MTLQFVRRHVERSFAPVCDARQGWDRCPICGHFTGTHTHTHTWLICIRTQVFHAGQETGDEIASFHGGGGTASRNDPFPTIQRCSFRCFCTRKGLRVAVEMRDARRRCDFAMADLYRVMLSHGWRQCVGRMYTWCGDARDRCGNGWKKKKGNKNRWSIDRYFWYRYAREEINKEKYIYIL